MAWWRQKLGELSNESIVAMVESTPHMTSRIIVVSATSNIRRIFMVIHNIMV